MKYLKFALILSLFTSTFFAACKKDDDDDGDSSENACKVSTVQYYDSGQVVQTGTYTYTGNQVTRIQYDTYNSTFEYTGNNISKRNYFVSAGASPELYDQVSYNSDGTISKIESFGQTQTSYEPYFRVDFVYSGGKLNKTTYYEVDGGTTTPLFESAFTYTGNNITSVKLEGDSIQATTLEYTYDTNPNRLKKQNSQIFLVENTFNLNFFITSSLQGTLFLPMAFSENNVTGVSNSTVSYESDDRQNLKDIKIENELFIRYNYLCQ
jgi:hypothetical protein